MQLLTDDLKVEELDAAISLLKESRHAFLRLFDASPICMSMTTTDPDRRTYVRVNKKFLETFGFDESEIIGRTSVEIGILDKAESLRVGETIRSKGRLQNDYVRCWAKDGEAVHTISSIEAMELNHERLLVSFFVDVTAMVEQRALIESHSQRLLAVNKELESFSYTVSHDLKNPLSGIEACIRLLEDYYSNGLDQEGKKLLSLVRQGTNRMHRLIGDLLAFARLGKESLDRESIDMNQLVQEVLEELMIANPHKARIDVGTLHEIRADRALMKQVLSNLISNAVKFSSKKPDPQVAITASSDNGIVALTVSDNGAGFDMAYAGKLFNAFHRLHAQSDFDGTGVGLATVHRIIHHHDGTINAEAEVGKGAKFTIRLPLMD